MTAAVTPVTPFCRGASEPVGVRRRDHLAPHVLAEGFDVEVNVTADLHPRRRDAEPALALRLPNGDAALIAHFLLGNESIEQVDLSFGHERTSDVGCSPVSAANVAYSAANVNGGRLK